LVDFKLGVVMSMMLDLELGVSVVHSLVGGEGQAWMEAVLRCRDVSYDFRFIGCQVGCSDVDDVGFGVGCFDGTVVGRGVNGKLGWKRF